MPETPESRERLARLETQMENLTDELRDAKDAIKELTAALNQMQGGLSAARWVGGLFTAGGFAVIGAAWSVYTWVKGGN